MKVKGFGAWPSRNSLIGGQRRSYDEYNNSSKGEERFPSAEEYASRKVEEYKHYSEQQDLTKEPDDEQAKKEQKKKKDQARRKRMVQQVMVLVAGSIIVVTAYQARAAKSAQQQADEPTTIAVQTEPGDSDDNKDKNDNNAGKNATPDEPATTEPTTEAQTDAASGASQSDYSSFAIDDSTTGTWRWSDDGSTATLVITDSSGNVIAEVNADISITEDPAGCRTEGLITRTASAQYNGQTYTDIHTEATSALGHTFNSGKDVTLDNGDTAVEFECERCHEHFVVRNSVTEE